MCGRYTVSSPKQRIIDVFAVREWFEDELAPRYNAAPTQWLPIVREVDSVRRLDVLRWGLIPSWSKDPAIGDRQASMINARSETVAIKPAYRAAYRRRRCLVPANGFYEWGRGELGGKQPYYIYPESSDYPAHHPAHVDAQDDSIEPLLGLAGLWEHWQSADGSEIESYTILTTTPNELVRPIHDRMPVVIPAQAYARWLDPESSGEEVAGLLRPWPAERMGCHPVSKRVGQARVDDVSLTQRATTGGLFEGM